MENRSGCNTRQLKILQNEHIQNVLIYVNEYFLCTKLIVTNCLCSARDIQNF